MYSVVILIVIIKMKVILIVKTKINKILLKKTIKFEENN